MVVDLLERYVSQSQSLLIFLSDGFFSSRNTMREVGAAIGQHKPLVLLCDRMLDSPEVIEQRRHECQQRLYEAVFGPPDDQRLVIPWTRQAGEFQRESLRLVAMQVLRVTSTHGMDVELHMATSVRMKSLLFDPSMRLEFSHHNPGAQGAAFELGKGVENLSVAPFITRETSKKKADRLLGKVRHQSCTMIGQLATGAVARMTRQSSCGDVRSSRGIMSILKGSRASSRSLAASRFAKFAEDKKDEARSRRPRDYMFILYLNGGTPPVLEP